MTAMLPPENLTRRLDILAYLCSVLQGVVRRRSARNYRRILMKLGVFAVMFSSMPFEKALDYIQSVGVQAIEIGCGGYIGDAHCKPADS